jgi:hypothetical protein
LWMAVSILPARLSKKRERWGLLSPTLSGQRRFYAFSVCSKHNERLGYIHWLRPTRTRALGLKPDRFKIAYAALKAPLFHGAGCHSIAGLEGLRHPKTRDCYCGLGTSRSDVDAGAGTAGEVLLAGGPGSALCETGFRDAARGASGPVVIALSGFSR